MVASESSFSTGEIILDSFQSSLSASMVEALICTQSWLCSSSSVVDIRKSMEEIQANEETEEGIVVCCYSGKCSSFLISLGAAICPISIVLCTYAIKRTCALQWVQLVVCCYLSDLRFGDLFSNHVICFNSFGNQSLYWAWARVALTRMSTIGL